LSTVYLSLGSNTGDRQTHLRNALSHIPGKIGKILTLSGFYQTQPWGYVSQEPYLNMAIAVETALNPATLLSETQAIEKTVGRRDKTINGVYHDRIIDIDILLYDDLIIQSPTLTIPHPLMHQRTFVLHPLAEIAPHLIHPVLKKTIAELSFISSTTD
jgi:2-amino-4-hydroxy-6-hydroxymethyldihydropteridine diphosphokinase